MKKIIISLILLVCNTISYADFTYSKGGINFEHCKVGVSSIMNLMGSSTVLQNSINDFCNNKVVIDIKFQETPDFMSVIIIYKEK